MLVNLARTSSSAGSAQDSYAAALATVLISAGVTAVPIVLHFSGQPIAIALCVLLSVILVGIATASIPIALIFSYLFQNTFVSLVSPQITSLEQVNSIRAYNFVMTATVWLVLTVGYWLERRTMARRMRLMIDVTTAALVLIGCYFMLGVASNPENAATYLRNIAAPFLLFQIFALVAYRYPVPFLKPLTIITALVVAYGFFEVFAQETLFRIVNGDVYLTWRMRQDYDAGVYLTQLRETGQVLRSYLDTLVIDFFNTPLIPETGLKLNRLLGPNFHSISFAYALIVLAMILAAAGRWWWPLLVLPLIAVVGSKGALLVLVFALTFLLLAECLRPFRNLIWYFCTLGAYTASGIVVGLHAGDYHVIGFIGGVRGFLSNPVGRGIGAGGNLSLGVSSVDWSKSQQLGHTDVAVESAVGVLMYQMGVASFAILGVLLWIVFELWRHYRLTGQRLYAVVALGTTAIMFNGIFQEEALFAPLALGLMFAFAGLLLGATYRSAPAGAAPVRRHYPAVAT